ncbi:UvrD-helicase domain-containing protein [Alistipes ihumii]|uniref:UvrD-helicase domain-containing protein n=1 Tax=Alistipes ihumii TaxID=1470347 RepID=UPI003994E440
MIAGSEDALKFVDDYFALNYASFLNLYFKGSRQSEIKRNITPAKYRQLFGELSPAQLQIIRDQESKYIVVAAGPGSGKTRVLVHNRIPDAHGGCQARTVAHAYFSRAAATVQKAVTQTDRQRRQFHRIKTFHSYCLICWGRSAVWKELTMF